MQETTTQGAYQPIPLRSNTRQRLTPLRVPDPKLLEFSPSPLMPRYSGRVSTFYSSCRASYSETYEPPRVTQFGPISRVESRFIGDEWRHIAVRADGKTLQRSASQFRLFNENELPLLFEPELERETAKYILTENGNEEAVRINKHTIVHGSRDHSSVGIIRILQ